MLEKPDFACAVGLHIILTCLCTQICGVIPLSLHGQSTQDVKFTWSPIANELEYRNPIIYADYSDPDVIRVGDQYYMTASSFSHFPGLPILHSEDLVHWEIIGHAAQDYPFSEFHQPQHGNGIWAPSLRYHAGLFYIYFGDPDHGVLMTRATDPAGPWEPLRLVKKVTGWIDCCPFWDEDGNAYLVHAFANSRAGINSILGICPMNPEGTEVYSPTTIVINGQKDFPTLEGPKMYQRNGYYYIFAPAGGVKPGWQTVFRSRQIYGPYESRITLEQGSTQINGPHQGGWVSTPTGEDWFIHFQDRYAYGRLVHLQPMRWVDDWPVMGEDFDQNGIGEPVTHFRKPNTHTPLVQVVPQTSDEFSSDQLGLQWQWEALPSGSWYSLSDRSGALRLYPQQMTGSNFWSAGNLCLQKFPAPDFTATTLLTSVLQSGEQAGLIVFGLSYSYLALEHTTAGTRLVLKSCSDAEHDNAEVTEFALPFDQASCHVQVRVWEANPGEQIPRVFCQFAYSPDGNHYKQIGSPFEAREGKWVGAKVGLFARTSGAGNGYADFEWFRITQ